MTDLISSSPTPLHPPRSFEKPVALSPETPPSAAAPDDAFDDHCSICLEAFTEQNPVTVTSCKHDYHLQCILEWSQRSKECPICWQLFVLKDPASQELLTAFETERNTKFWPRAISPFPPPPPDYSDYYDEVPAYIDDSDFEDRIMQHLAASAAASRARFRRRERHRTSGSGPSDTPEDFVFTSSTNNPGSQHINATSLRDPQSVLYVSHQPDSQTSDRAPVNFEPSSPINLFANTRLSPAVDRDGPTERRIFFRKPEPDSPQRASPSEAFSLSESIKSKWSAASARYKKSISKGTRGLKEKLLARNNSVGELSKGVQREMTARIASVTRIIEHLDLSFKRPGSPARGSNNAPGTSNFVSKGKGVQEINISHGLSNAPLITSSIPNQVEVSRT